LFVLLAVAGVVLPIPGAVRTGAVDRGSIGPAGGGDRKLIALSFDDVPRGPGAFYTKEQRTIRLIAALSEADVRQVAFFLNPGRISAGDGAEERIAAYTAAGHVLADHTFSHRDLSAVTAPAFLADIDRSQAWLRGRKGYRPWFRFPGLNQGGRDTAKRRVVLDGLAARHLMVAGVTVDGSDWYLDRLAQDAQKAGKSMNLDGLRDLYVETMVQSADFSDALMRRSIGRSPAHVLLLHETDLTTRYLGALIDGLRKDGWRIVPADTAFADPIYHSEPDIPFDNGTVSEAIAWERGITGPRWYERNDMKVASALFEQRVLGQVAPTRAPAAASAPTPKPDAQTAAARRLDWLRRVAARHRQCAARRGRAHRLCQELAASADRIHLSGTRS